MPLDRNVQYLPQEHPTHPKWCTQHNYLGRSAMMPRRIVATAQSPTTIQDPRHERGGGWKETELHINSAWLDAF
jgi:hypothetical protein